MPTLVNTAVDTGSEDRGKISLNCMRHHPSLLSHERKTLPAHSPLAMNAKTRV